MSSLWRSRLISVVIIVILGLQLFAVVFRTGSKGWPFMDYPMYATSHQENDRIVAESRLFATFANSTETLVTPRALGLGNRWWPYEVWILKPLRTDPSKPRRSNPWRAMLIDEDNAPSWFIFDRRTPERAIAFVVDRYRELHRKKIVELRLEDVGAVVTRQGMQRVPPQVLWSASVNSNSGGEG